MDSTDPTSSSIMSVGSNTVALRTSPRVPVGSRVPMYASIIKDEFRVPSALPDACGALLDGSSVCYHQGEIG